MSFTRSIAHWCEWEAGTTHFTDWHRKMLQSGHQVTEHVLWKGKDCIWTWRDELPGKHRRVKPGPKASWRMSVIKTGVSDVCRQYKEDSMALKLRNLICPVGDTTCFTGWRWMRSQVKNQAQGWVQSGSASHVFSNKEKACYIIPQQQR